MNRAYVLVAVAAAALLAAACDSRAPETEVVVVTSQPKTPTPGTKLATFGGGCFWCVEALFTRIDGVESVESGYAGGAVPSPTYKQVCMGTTGHAEVVQVRYDPKKVPYEKLLEVFFKTHDPTTLNKQGADEGTQYRSIVLWHDEEQKRIAADVKRRLEDAGAFDGPIVTQIVPYDRFWKAEDYHQGYFDANPSQGYCRMVIQPKVAKLEKVFKDLLKPVAR